MAPSSTSTETESPRTRPREALQASSAFKSYSAANGNVAPAPKREKGVFTSTSRTAALASDSDDDSVLGEVPGSSSGSSGDEAASRAAQSGQSSSSNKSRKAGKSSTSSKMTRLSKLFSPSSRPSSPSSTPQDKGKGKERSRPKTAVHAGRKLRATEIGPATGNVALDSDEEEYPSEDERRASVENMRELKEKQRRNVQSMDEAQVAGLQKAKEAPEKLDRMASQEADDRGRARTKAASEDTPSEQRARDLSPGAKRNSLLASKLPNLQLPEAITQKLTLPQFQIPIKDFPLQGSGKDSEFDQAHPVWAKQPYKYLYYAYFGLSVGLYHLPAWSLTSAVKSKRGRKDWSWKRATMVKLFRHGTKLTFRTHTNLGRDLTKEVPHSKTVKSKFVWVDELADEYISGELERAMKIQKIKALRTCGFWYGESGDGGVGQKAAPGEKVMFHLHGGAYWIGTAHESDVTAAVNTQALRYMHEIYESQKFADMSPTSSRNSTRSGDVRGEGGASGNGNGTASRSDLGSTIDAATGAERPASSSASSSSSSSSSSASKAAKAGPKVSTTDYTDPSAKAGRLLRTFSLDYRLCVPGKPQAGSYPAALLDALAGYRYLIEDLGFHPEDVIVAGDSAGGNLGIALCRYLRDEKVMPMPGSLLLMSPWADCSRSHSGPTGAPNLMSTAHRNIKSDIISPCLAFRNTAVSAFLGELPARETYRNPYLSSISLQLPPHKGGKGPFWGFEGFPKRIYITTGSAEISYDQHLTLAHRMAAGTKHGAPIYTGDKLSKGQDPAKLAGRYDYPRPKGLKISLSSATTPGSTPGSETTPAEQEHENEERAAASELFSDNDKDSDGQPEASIEELVSSAGEIVMRTRSKDGVSPSVNHRTDSDQVKMGAMRPVDSSRTDAATSEKVDETMLPSQRQQQMEEKELKQDLREADALPSHRREGEAPRPRGEQRELEDANAAQREAIDVELARDEDRQTEEMAKVRRGQEGYSLAAPAGRMTEEATKKRKGSRGQAGAGSAGAQERRPDSGTCAQHDEADDVIKAQDFIGDDNDDDDDAGSSSMSSQRATDGEGKQRRHRLKNKLFRREPSNTVPTTPQIRISPPESEADAVDDDEGRTGRSGDGAGGGGGGSYFDLGRRRTNFPAPPSGPRRRAYSEVSPLTPWMQASPSASASSSHLDSLSNNGSTWSVASGATATSSYHPEHDDRAQPHHELEERVVILDEVKDAIHDYLLFSWFEPERSSTWRRIAKWIHEA
ncbi:uncharacterized protein PFL1_04952 [Pseudozyma flocculosa PF-1]|uniref:Alpha/beta hydrolase fold-3 domain-containing protein n=2 Tax=Pseudozyma flocculosa TaxID=84751 RepID=A0A5C3EWM0_9BASI|nr:uncharacterized protein PFL1_04952 [Pseudozyma flocculosa PF-1]EPQ27414.1 hypothetical protein PFL1_04952 [Pseudozyma flocculosa PF-1]SPO36165.1 uncharacterized protein PSFLO_01636 [Pseudozyma flocculosa]